LNFVFCLSKHDLSDYVGHHQEKSKCVYECRDVRGIHCILDKHALVPC